MNTVVNSILEAKQLILNKLASIASIDLEKTLLKNGRIETFASDHPKGSVVIHYAGSSYNDESPGSTIVKQLRVLRIAAFVQIRIEHGIDYRDNMIELIIKSISGLKFKAITKLDRIKPLSDEYLTPEKEEQLKYYEHSIVFLVPAQFQQSENFN